jgi:putative redox protein
MNKVIVKNLEGITFASHGSSNHWVITDGPKEHGGSDAGTRPMELFLISLGTCTGADVASLLQKMRVDYRKFEIEIEAERAEEHPKVYTKINLIYKLWGDNLPAQQEKIEKAIDLSQNKYCSVSAMIKAAKISLQYSLELSDKKSYPS